MIGLSGEEGGSTGQPWHQASSDAVGGVVRDTGFALVHRGELILPAPGSEAVVEALQHDQRTTINYRFDVEVEYVGSLGDARQEEIINETLRRLRRAIENQPED